eukprot:13326-Heterococcus_DN1.PRE.1
MGSASACSCASLLLQSIGAGWNCIELGQPAINRLVAPSEGSLNLLGGFESLLSLDDCVLTRSGRLMCEQTVVQRHCDVSACGPAVEPPSAE